MSVKTESTTGVGTDKPRDTMPTMCSPEVVDQAFKSAGFPPHDISDPAEIGIKVDLPERVIEQIAQSNGFPGPFSEKFFKFCQELKDETIARIRLPTKQDAEVSCGNGCACMTDCGDHYEHAGTQPPEKSPADVWKQACKDSQCVVLNTFRHLLITEDDVASLGRAFDREGEVVVTTNPDGDCVAVTRQDAEHRILKTIWVKRKPKTLGDMIDGLKFNVMAGHPDMHEAIKDAMRDAYNLGRDDRS